MFSSKQSAACLDTFCWHMMEHVPGHTAVLAARDCVMMSYSYGRHTLYV